MLVKNLKKMSSNVFEKILRILSIAINILQMALKSFSGIVDDDPETEAE